MAIAKNIKAVISGSSFIRLMFEKGAKLKALHGQDKVFDFSLGNPNLKPPKQFKEELIKVASLDKEGIHGYMPNAGLPETRESVATYISTEQEITVSKDEIIMTCGAAGGANVTFKTILNPDDEVIVPSPYFVEYSFYVSNFNATLKTVETKEDFSLDLEAIRKAITPKTKVMLINSPNNPTGQIYSDESLAKLGDILREKSQEYGNIIFLVADEPYRKIVYDGVVVPSVFKHYKESILLTSYSKDLSIPGERLGFIAVHPKATDRSDLITGMTLTNRTLGFVNAPALMQRAIINVQGLSVDMSQYTRKRQILCDGLKKAGYEFNIPPGSFYLFIKSPIPDDIEFINMLQEELIMAVPGSAFGKTGYFRLAYCTSDETIKNSLPAFEKVMNKCKNK